MVLACDMRIATPETTCFYPVMKLGFTPPAPDVDRLKSLIGPSRTRVYLLTGLRLTSNEAQCWGLIDRICADPLAEANALVPPVLARPEHAMAIKTSIFNNK